MIKTVLIMPHIKILPCLCRRLLSKRSRQAVDSGITLRHNLTGQPQTLKQPMLLSARSRQSCIIAV